MKLLRVNLNPFRRSRVVVQAPAPQVIVQAPAPAPAVVVVDPKAELQAMLLRKQTRRAELAQALAALDEEIAKLLIAIG